MRKQHYLNIVLVAKFVDTNYELEGAFWDVYFCKV